MDCFWFRSTCYYIFIPPSNLTHICYQPFSKANNFFHQLLNSSLTLLNLVQSVAVKSTIPTFASLQYPFYVLSKPVSQSSTKYMQKHISVQAICGMASLAEATASNSSYIENILQLKYYQTISLAPSIYRNEQHDCQESPLKHSSYLQRDYSIQT